MQSEDAHQQLMEGLEVYHIRFEVRSLERVQFSGAPGSALRGALYHALSRQFCADAGARHLPDHHAACPVCWLLATEDPQQERGRDLPRPLAIRPPSGAAVFEAGVDWSFGVVLAGQRALASFPHLVRAVQEMGASGVGSGRGRFRLLDVHEANPLLGSDRSLVRERRVTPPQTPVTAQQVTARAQVLPQRTLTLRFLTPLRVGEKDQLMRRPDLGVLTRRLLERCQSMAVHYGRSNPAAQERENWRNLSLYLSEVAERARLVANETHWEDAWSGSRRTGRMSPLGGLVGLARWEGEIAPLIPWMLWGQSLQVGKSTVKGNGWFEVMEG